MGSDVKSLNVLCLERLGMMSIYSKADRLKSWEGPLNTMSPILCRLLCSQATDEIENSSRHQKGVYTHVLFVFDLTVLQLTFTHNTDFMVADTKYCFNYYHLVGGRVNTLSFRK